MNWRHTLCVNWICISYAGDKDGYILINLWTESVILEDCSLHDVARAGDVARIGPHVRFSRVVEPAAALCAAAVARALLVHRNSRVCSPVTSLRLVAHCLHCRRAPPVAFERTTLRQPGRVLKRALLLHSIHRSMGSAACRNEGHWPPKFLFGG